MALHVFVQVAEVGTSDSASDVDSKAFTPGISIGEVLSDMGYSTTNKKILLDGVEVTTSTLLDNTSPSVRIVLSPKKVAGAA